MGEAKSVANRAKDVTLPSDAPILGKKGLVGEPATGVQHNPVAQSKNPNSFGVKNLDFKRVDSGY